MSQVEMAEAMKCTQSFLSHIEHDRSGPSTGILSALELLNISPSWLMTGQGSMLRSPSLESLESLSSLPPSAVRDGPCSSLPPRVVIELPPDVQAGDTILVEIERRDHPLALIGKIIYTIRGK